jgi:hypothetical protein
MVRVRSPLFSLEARGHVAGLEVTRRSGLAQIIRRWALKPPTYSLPHFLDKARFARFVAAYQTELADPYERYCWDRLRRYYGYSGTGMNRFLSDYMLRTHRGSLLYFLTQATINRIVGFPNLLQRVHLNRRPSAVWAAYGPSAAYPSTVSFLNEEFPGIWQGIVSDRWPGKRVFCRYRAKYPDGEIIGWSGLCATTSNG